MGREWRTDQDGVSEALHQGKPAATDRRPLPSLTHSFTLDLVICCRSRAEEALARMRDIMTRLKLTVNETKTRVCKLPGEKFDFLGIHVWSVLFAENGPCVPWHGSFEEAGDPHLRND